MNRCSWGTGVPEVWQRGKVRYICVSIFMNYSASPHEMAAEGKLKEEPGYGWQMCCAAGTQVQAVLMSKRRPCGLNSLICCHHTYDESILGSVPLRLPPSRTNQIPNAAIWSPRQDSRASWLWPVGNGPLMGRAYLCLLEVLTLIYHH